MIQKLEDYGQQHLLRFYEELGKEQKEKLLKQIEEIDFGILSLVKSNSEHKKGKIEPIEALKIDEIAPNRVKYYQTGLHTIQEGRVACVLLAGGQGTRLGFDKPKGTLNVGIDRELYLFEILIENLMETVRATGGTWIHLFVMTSDINNDDTVSFFEENEYFGYNRDYVTFFIQEMTPAVDFEGKIYLEEKGKIAVSPNGNGGWFTSLKKYGILDRKECSGIEWLNVFSVDNVLQKMADPYFVGATVESGYPCGSKVIKKAYPDEKVGVMCKENGKPSIVEYYELTPEMISEKDPSGNPAYNYGVILNYLFRLKDLDDKVNKNLPVHIVEKKIPYIDESGTQVRPDVPNGYKFETLVLDMINLMDDCLVYEVVREEEFAPIKNKEGQDSLDTARKMLIQNGKNI
ncbi:UTP--glucose-1-phosphate uridylyltransferase [Parasporobacterium paucivorans]|uniref:UDP-N-acetylglucosamine/UDP-N-acetylgalactosamine diphosphorylase n=1 Tax=Parasporobacterium paucivorans DSM 15970 TaxID=1122934 RepID=A0A1M6FNR5_9FIRM|nr:UDPGP type 1 family protein [Parasporobacterium paucivorans]SHI99305.1 UDP-N-acetylglucosamine/UDP-N-acetylgalactosaminediphosphorylase [Parasporobacterium paucivorans DSM 15970]